MIAQRRYSPANKYARRGSSPGCPCPPWLPIQTLSVFLISLGCVYGQAERGGGQEEQSKTAQSAEQLLAEANRLLGDKIFDQAADLAHQAALKSPQSARVLQAAAEILYLSGRSKESVPLFDRVVELSPATAPQNWQRGIALSSSGDFAAGAEQFKTHHDVNPDDVENSAWYFLCIAKTRSVEEARKTVIPSRGDGREPMMSILQMLKGEIEPEGVLQAAEKNSAAGRARQSAMFYADLYVGLYYDSLGKNEEARKYLERSQSYGIDGYMVRTAQVYLEDRFPEERVQEKGESK